MVGAAADHAEVEFVRVAVGGFLAEEAEPGLFGVVVFCSEGVVLSGCLVSRCVFLWGEGERGVEDFVLFEDAPFGSFQWLGPLAVVAALDRIAHGRHGLEKGLGRIRAVLVLGSR